MGAEVTVTVGGAVLALAWFSFRPEEARHAELRGDVQAIEIKVGGGYSPDGDREEAAPDAAPARPARAGPSSRCSAAG